MFCGMHQQKFEVLKGPIWETDPRFNERRRVCYVSGLVNTYSEIGMCDCNLDTHEGVAIDAGLVDVIIHLNTIGLSTAFHCSGLQQDHDRSNSTLIGTYQHHADEFIYGSGDYLRSGYISFQDPILVVRALKNHQTLKNLVYIKPGLYIRGERSWTDEDKQNCWNQLLELSL